MQQRGFADWRLAIDGMVARPASLTLADIKRFPLQSHIIMIQCEEGWSYVPEWIGTPLAHVLDLAGTLSFWSG